MQTLAYTPATASAMLLSVDFMTVDDMYDDVAVEELVAFEYNED